VTASAATVSELIEVDEKLLDDAAAGLGINCGDSEQVKDLVAVAMTRLAWRDGPVEDWHWIRHRRIGDGEIMRANAATTRVVRDAMDQVHEPGGMFQRVGRVLADPHRQLPDGRLLIELAPSPLEFARYQAHVAACCARWESTAADIGEAPVFTLLACRGARFNWHWWRSTGWLRLVDEFIRRLDDPERWSDAWELINRRRLGDPPGGMTSEELRLQLLAGPDRLDTATAQFCLRAGLSALKPHHCGLPPVLRHPLPAGYFALIEADTPIRPNETDAP
jgi:hypothetical protein